MSADEDPDRAARQRDKIARFLEHYSAGKDAVPRLTPLAAAVRVEFQLMDRIKRGRRHAGH